MSDEPTAGPTAPVTTATPETPSDAYGQPISTARKAELQRYLDRWQAETDHGDRKGPFDGVRLTGADASWLAEQSGRDILGQVPNLHLEGADLYFAHLERAILIAAHLEGTNLIVAHLRRAILRAAHLEGTNLGDAQLEGANLRAAHLEGADLNTAHLQRADLREAHLEGAVLAGAHLEGAILAGAWLDSKTALIDATLDTSTRLGDIQWSGVGAVNLTRLPWEAIPTLGDERGVGLRSRDADYEAAVRAYRQLAAQLRAQGLSEVADRFAERAQIRQRKRLFRQLLVDWRRPWLLPRNLARWLFSWFLALLAGYGYHPGRSVFWYLATITTFAALYIRFGVVYGHAFNPVEAAVFSLTSFHGRGFFPGGLKLDDPVTVLAAIEAVIGLLIEISFIATFTQRFFGSK